MTATRSEGLLPAVADVIAGLDAVELVRVRLPLRSSVESAHGRESIREVVLVHAVGHDGAEGWGECSALEAPTYTGEYTDGAWSVLRDHLVPGALAGRFGLVRGHPMASTALEVALTDLDLRRSGRSLLDALEVPPAGRGGCAWTAVIGIGSIAETVDAVDRARTGLASAVKLKIRPGWDLEPVGAVLAAHPGLDVAVDANGSYRRDEAHRLVEVGAALAGLEGAYVEQPLAVDDLLGHAQLAREVPVPLALDESIRTPGDAAVAASIGSATLVNLKPARLGGLRASLRLSDVLAGLEPEARPGVFLGGMFETGVGRSAALSIAAATGLGITRTDLGPSSWYFERDLTEPLDLGFDARAWPPTGPGIGPPPLVDRLAELTVDRLLLRP